MRVVIKLVKKIAWLEQLIWNRGFLRKFGVRQVVFNVLTNVLSNNNRWGALCCHFTSRVINPKGLELLGDKRGTFSSLVLSGGCYIQAGNGVSIGEGTIWGPNVSIVSANHGMADDNKSWVRGSGIRIGNDCWIGAGATILPDVVIGNRCVVAAGSVVTKAFPDDDLVIGGIPAKIIKHNKQSSGEELK